MDKTAASRLRQELHCLRQERNALEEELLGIRALVRGSLITHHSLSGGKRRSRPAFYVFRREGGRKRLVYVRKLDEERVLSQLGAYRRYREALRRLKALAHKIVETYQGLVQSQDTLP